MMRTNRSNTRKATKASFGSAVVHGLQPGFFCLDLEVHNETGKIWGGGWKWKAVVICMFNRILADI